MNKQNLGETPYLQSTKVASKVQISDSTGGHHMVLRSKSKQIAPHIALLATNSEAYIEPRTINQALRLPY